MRVYPLFLNDLSNRRCLVIGGGNEAERKVGGLLEADAKVTVISEKMTSQLHSWADQGSIAWLRREYEWGDLRQAALVIATGSNSSQNALIRQEADEEGVLLNVADDPSLCNFIAGSVFRQGPLVISVSTSGCSPALAVRIKQQLAVKFGPEYAAFLELLGSLRETLAAQFPHFSERRARWYALVDSDIIDHLRDDRPDLARERIEQILVASSPDNE